jgi:hypothetical protein
MFRYYGFYSNVSRGKRKKQDQDKLISSILEPEGPSNEYRKNWARLIQKIYEVDSLTCPKWSGAVRVISVIEDEKVIEKILKHLSLREAKARPSPKTKAPPLTVYIDCPDPWLQTNTQESITGIPQSERAGSIGFGFFYWQYFPSIESLSAARKPVIARI